MDFVGVDGCRAGWFFVHGRGRSDHLDFGVVPNLVCLIADLPTEARIFVDIPIGLRDRCAEPRRCDTEARKLLGRGRASSVFPPPIRAILRESSYAAAVASSKNLCRKKLTRQAFGILPKIREVDDLLTENPRARSIVREVHPELCFWAFAGRKAMTYRKKSVKGFRERMEVLKQVLPCSTELVDAALGRYQRREVACDDIVDALVVAATASAPAAALRTLPQIPEYDSKRLPMEMVYSTINWDGDGA